MTTRAATGLILALLVLPAPAAAQVQPNPDNRTAAVPAEPVPAVTATAPVRPNADNRTVTTAGQDLRSPDAVDAARGQELGNDQPQPPAVAEKPGPPHDAGWPAIAFGAAVLLIVAGGLAGTRIRSRRSSRAAA